jgi:molybdopterin synthase catalytic subunit
VEELKKRAPIWKHPAFANAAPPDTAKTGQLMAQA